LVQDGNILPERSYTRRGATLAGSPLTGLVDARAALARFTEGATVVFQGVHRYHRPLAHIVGELEVELGHPCQANAYLTPAGSQGFATHQDTHDVFVVQTVGRKRWQVGEPPELVHMEPGLAMYLPTGTPHSARSEDAVSLHVTIGINQLTWRRLLRQAMESVLDKLPDGHLPAGYIDDSSELRDQLAGRLGALAQDVRSLDANEIVADQVRRFLTSRPVRQAHGLRDSLATISDDSPLRRVPGRPCVLEAVAAPDRVGVLLGDRRLDVPAWLGPALEWIRSSNYLRPADLAQLLDRESRLVLCRRLVRENLLTLADE
jgi:mannose-6-phosphate isomerase-like protein (cupin superfamily)